MPVAATVADTAIANTINGAKELKQYIQDMTRLAESICAVFERDLQQPRAVVNYQDNDSISIGQGNHEFNAKMCQVAHDDFVYNHTRLSQSSQFLQYESVVKDCLARLEELRKMLVNNKQQKKTTINAIRRIIITDINSSFNSAQVFEEEIAYQSPCVIMLRGLIEQTKQNHKTVNRNILDQVRAIVLDMRSRHIRMFEQAAQQTVEAIIEHADKCRVFMTQCRHLAIVEYCAYLWLTKTQQEQYHQQNNYYVSALLAEDNGELKRFNAASASGLSVAASRRPMNVQIFIHERNEMRQPAKDECILTYDLDESLAAEILTDEAIQTFEDDERDAKDAVREHQRLYANADAAADADADQVWNYWGHRDDVMACE